MDTQPDAHVVGLLLGTALMLLGIVVQFVVKMAAFEDAGEHYTPLGYLRLHPWRAAALVLTTFLLLWICHELGELTRVAAMLLGFTCEQSNDTLRGIANKRANR